MHSNNIPSGVGPLEVFFTDDTPIIRSGEREIEVLLNSNKPTSAICRLITRGQRTEQDCKLTVYSEVACKTGSQYYMVNPILVHPIGNSLKKQKTCT